MIRLTEISKIFDTGKQQVSALQNINLHIKSGEIFGIIGYSGAGKSTLLRCMNLLERPTSGKVVVNGQDLMALSEAELRQARHSIGMIFQHFNLLSSRTVYENVAFPLEIVGMPKDQIKGTVLNMLELVGLADKAQAYPAQLSGGQKQRVGIARALASKPKVLLCDEATSALDPETTASILQLLKEINHKLGLTIVLITHEMHVIKEICHQVAVIEKGSIVEQSSVVDVFTAPQHSTTKGFIKNIINHDIPEEIRRRHLLHVQENSQVLKVTFLGDSASQPVISDAVKQYDLDVNILYGNVDHIQDTLIGVLILEVTGLKENREKAVAYLQQKGLKVEVIANVA